MKLVYLCYAPLLVACGNFSDQVPRTERVVQQFLASGQPTPSTLEQAAQLEFLNSCTVAQICTSGFTDETPESEIDRRLLEFMKRCSDENGRQVDRAKRGDSARL